MPGKRIGIDIRALTPPITGTGVYLREILRRLPALAPEHRFFGYTTKPTTAENLPDGPFRLRLGAGVTARWGTLWLQTGVMRLLREDRIDLFWGPLQILPLRAIGRIPTVLTVHDLVFHLYPGTMAWRNRIALPTVARGSIRGADRIMSVSGATADALTTELGIPRRKIRVIHHGVAERFAGADRAAARRRVQQRYGFDRDYLLFVGTLEPRKNLEGLLRSIMRLMDHGRFDGELLIVGARGWGGSNLEGLTAGHPLRDRLHLTGYVREDDLPDLYAGARVFVMPSLYEGFGLPVLEAMSSATPVVCAAVAPFPEIAGDAARLASLEDPDELGNALAEVWNDDALRRELSARGKSRAGAFSWDHAAAQVLDCFEELWRDAH